MEKTGKVILKSLINNNQAVNGARHKPWFIAVIMAFISLILSLIPTFVTALNQSGDKFIASNTYGTEYGLINTSVKFSEYAGAETLSIIKNESGKKVFDIPESTDVFYVNKHKEDQYVKIPLSEDTYKYEMQEVEVIDFVVYFKKTSDSKTFKAFRNNIKAGKVNPYNTEEPANPDYKGKSFLLISERQIAMTIYVNGSEKVSYAGDTVTFKEGYSLKDLALVKTSDGSEVSPVDADTSLAFRNGVMKNYKSFFKLGYENNKIISLWTNTGILAAVNVVVMFFMGLLMFILTRGKKNPFRIYTFWDTQKIAYWASPSPAVLSVGVGFLFSSFAAMAFVLLFGLRIMWLSMKELRPQVQD